MSEQGSCMITWHSEGCVACQGSTYRIRFIYTSSSLYSDYDNTYALCLYVLIRIKGNQLVRSPDPPFLHRKGVQETVEKREIYSISVFSLALSSALGPPLLLPFGRFCDDVSKRRGNRGFVCEILIIIGGMCRWRLR